MHVILNPGGQIQEITVRPGSIDRQAEFTVKCAEKFVADLNRNPLLNFPDGSRVTRVHLLVALEKKANDV